MSEEQVKKMREVLDKAPADDLPTALGRMVDILYNGDRKAWAKFRCVKCVEKTPELATCFHKGELLCVEHFKATLEEEFDPLLLSQADDEVKEEDL